MPEERGVRPLEAKLHGLIIQLADALHAVSKLQTVEVGKTAAVDVVPRMVAVKNTAKGKNDVIGIKVPGRGGAGESGRWRRYRELPSSPPARGPAGRYRDRRQADDRRSERPVYRQSGRC